MPRKTSKSSGGSGKSVVILANKDKDRIPKEKWSKGRDLGCLPHPFRAVFLGGVGRGKTNCMKNIFLEHQISKKPFKEMIVVAPDGSEEWNDCNPTQVLKSLPDVEAFNPKNKTILIIDDFELCQMAKSEQRKLALIFRFVSSHCNVSVLLSYQSYFQTPPICRKTCSVFVIWKPNGLQELQTIENRCGVSKGRLVELFGEYNSPYDNVMIDNTIGAPSRLRCNIYNCVEDCKPKVSKVSKSKSKKVVKKPVKKGRKKKVVLSSSEESSESDSDSDY